MRGGPRTRHATEIDIGSASERAFLGVGALIFATSVAVTIAWCSSMSGTGGMPMPGGWTMSMVWMRMPGQSWIGAGLAFMGMWTVMMLPSLLPMLRRYRQAVARTDEIQLGWLTSVVALGYFFVWTVIGLVAFPIGAVLASVQMQWPMLASALPMAIGLVVLIAGVLQFTTWKARQLACCREMALSE